MKLSNLHYLQKERAFIKNMATKSAKKFKMNNENSLHEGEILRLLIKRAGFRVDEFAKSLDLNPNNLSRIFRSEKLTKKVKSKSASILGVDISIFETGFSYDISESQGSVEEPDEEFLALEAEVARLEEENRQLAEELLKEKAISDELRKLLLKMVKR